MTEQPIGVGVVSFAHSHGAMWAEAFREDPRCRLVAVWDDDLERGKREADRLETPFIAELAELLALPDVDAVAVTSEHGRHEDHVVAAAEAGKHILCEKPMATTLEGCDRMIDAIEAAGVTYMQGFQMRFDPAYRYVHDLVRSGELGRISTVYKRHSHPYGLHGWPHGYGDWFFDRQLAGGGAGMDEVIHSCDWLRWMFGEPTSVVAEWASVLGGEVEDNLAAIFRFGESGPIAILQSSWTEVAGTVTTQIFGDRGSVIQSYTDLTSTRLPRPHPAPILVYREGASDWETPSVDEGFSAIHQLVARRFVDCLVEGGEPPVTAEDGRKAVEMVLGIYRSARTGAACRFPLEEEDSGGNSNT